MRPTRQLVLGVAVVGAALLGWAEWAVGQFDPAGPGQATVRPPSRVAQGTPDFYAAPPPAYLVEEMPPEVYANPAYEPLRLDRGCCGWTHNLLLFGGVHGFKGPTDLGRNGNFGFHEGLNFGGPIGDPWGFSFQAGFQAVHSNFAGDQTLHDGLLADFRGADRNQLFFTAGIFRRAFGSGWQTGMAFDLFYDSYYGQTTLQQIRSETAWVLSDLREIGYWGAYGISTDMITGIGKFDTLLAPTDLFAAFYRRHFTGGGQGRIWAGLSGNGDVIFGLDGTVPLGTSWGLDNNFTCLFPKQGRNSGGQTEESWSVSMHLVWYPGRQSRRVFLNPHQPLFYVADNSWFLVDRR